MKLNRKGLTGTIIYHILLILLLIFAGLTYPDPPPEEEGILVNFGTDDTGFGDYEPEGDDQNAGDPDLPVVEESTKPVQEVVETSPPKPDPKPVDNTQDLEVTKVVEKPKPTAEELQKQREAEIRRQQEIEAEKKRQEELEAERKKQEKLNEIDNRGRNAFGNQGVGEETGSQGEAGGSGNQGVTTGSPDADRYGVGGGLGDGISYGLGTRKAVGSIPKPLVDNCQVTMRITVTVEIQVDRDGKVVGAIVKDATVQDGCIWDAVVAAASRTRFTGDPNANIKQTGWIRYIIEP